MALDPPTHFQILDVWNFLTLQHPLIVDSEVTNHITLCECMKAWQSSMGPSYIWLIQNESYIGSEEKPAHFPLTPATN